MFDFHCLRDGCLLRADTDDVLCTERYEKVREQINSAMRFIMVISFPCAIGLAVLGEPICRLLFPGTAQTAPMAGTMMWVGAMAVVFYAMSTLSNGLLQGIDRLKIPVINAAVSLVAHVIVLIILMLFFPHEYLCGHYRKYVLCVFNVYYECAGNTKIQRLSSGNSQNIYCAGNFLSYYGNYYLYRLSWQLCGLKNQCGICHALQFLQRLSYMQLSYCYCTD